MSRGKKYVSALSKVDSNREYPLQKAINLIKEMNYVKFDSSLEGHFNIKYKSLQNVRGILDLPHGTGKDVKVLVFAKGEKAEEAKAAGANYVGDNDLIQKISDGWLDFDQVVSVPDMMKDVGKLGPILGKKGMMPKPKSGTVTTDIKGIINQLKAGRQEFRVDKTGVVHVPMGRLSFDTSKLLENSMATFQGILKSKPSDAKGDYIVAFHVAGTMTPSVKINTKDLR